MFLVHTSTLSYTLPPPPQSPTIPFDFTLSSPLKFDLDPYEIGVRQSKRARIEKKNIWSQNATPQPLPSADSAAWPAAASATGSTAEPANNEINIINQ